MTRDLVDLMLIPGLSGPEDRVRRHIAGRLAAEGVESRAERPGNLIATFPGEAGAPSGRDVAGVIANKSHHATAPEEKYAVLKTPELRIDTGHGLRAGGVRNGTPVVYRPNAAAPAGGRIAGSGNGED